MLVNLRRLSVAAVILVLAAGPARAEPQPPPPPPPSGPIAVPYPDPQPLPPECHNRFCLPKPGATQGGGEVAAHKHIAGVKYEDIKSAEPATAAPAVDTQVIEAQSISFDAGTLHSADPMEGGQVTSAERRMRPGRPTYGNLTDAPAMVAEPGKLEYPNVQVAGGDGTAAKTSATFTTLASKLVKGKHLDKVTITTRSGSYTLHDAIVTDVVPAGDGMETVSLSYASKDD